MTPSEAGPAAICWCDLEMTGLDAERDTILECAIITTDWGLNVIEQRHWLVKPENFEQAIDGMSEYVFMMHRNNGLLAELMSERPPYPRVGLLQLDDYLCDAAMIFQHGVPAREQNRPLLGGFNPQKDREFLQRYAPRFCEQISDLNFDQLGNRLWVSATYDSLTPPAKAENHRAVEDCRAALDFARWFRAQVMSPHGRKHL